MAVELLPGWLDLDLYRGDTLSQAFQFSDGTDPLVLPTTGWSAQVRNSPDDDTVLVTFTVDASGAASGLVVVSLTATQTAALSNRTAVWDLQLTEGTVVRTYLRGGFQVVRDVTRP